MLIENHCSIPIKMKGGNYIMLVPAICPQCGGKIKVDCDKEAAVCEFCGTPFVVDKAIHIYRTSVVNNNNFAGATVNIQQGNVDNLLTLARNAESVNNNEEALQYYTRVLELQPNNCEALVGKGVNALIGSSLDDIRSDELIGYAAKAIDYKRDEYGTSDKEVAEFVFQTAIKLYHCAIVVLSAAQNHFQEFWKYEDAAPKYWQQLNSVREILYCVASYTEPPKKSMDQNGVNIYLESLKFTIMCCIEACKERRYVAEIAGGEYVSSEIYGGVKLADEAHTIWLNYYDSAMEKIKKIDPNYEPDESINRSIKLRDKGGCYIATCVYGSYDCPEVWVLRRFRDYDLMQNPFGKAFVKVYYAISPTIVKVFGKQTVFRIFWKWNLDKLVKKLKSRGYDDTDYYGR